MKGVAALKEMARQSRYPMSPKIRNQQAIWHRGKAYSRLEKRTFGETQVLKLLCMYDSRNGRYKHHLRRKTFGVGSAFWHENDPVNTAEMCIDVGEREIAKARPVNGMLFWFFHDKPKKTDED